MTKGLEKERQLVERAKQDPSLFTEIYDCYYEAIYRYLYRRVDGVQTAEDLVSQTFFDALSHLKNYQFKGYPFSAWLYKIAHNNVLKWYRSHSVHQKVDLDNIVELCSDEDVVDDLHLRNEHGEVSACLAKMEYEDRELIRLKYFEEVSNIEIGQIMGITANNVGVKLYRALKKLKQLMEL